MDEKPVGDLYRRLLEAWNDDDAEGFAGCFSEDGKVVGFDGSLLIGRDQIRNEMARIFSDHQTGTYVGKIKRQRVLGPGIVLLDAVAGVVPPGADDIRPEQNSVQSLLAEESEAAWRLVLYHNTPAQFHGRPELAESLSAELREELRRTG